MVLILLGTSFQTLAAGGFGLLLPAIRLDLNLSYTEAGSLAAAATFVYALMQVPAGLLTDRFGPRRVFATGILATNGLLVLFAASGTYLVALAVQALSGLARALAFAPGLVLMSTWFVPARRATAIGLFVAGGSLWTVVFGVVAPAGLETADWRVVVGTAGGLGILVAVAFAGLGRAGPAAAEARGAAAFALGSLVREPVLWLACLVQSVRLAVVQGIALWLPTFLVDERDLPLAWAGVVIAVSALATAPSNLLGGIIADRLDRPFLVIAGSLATLALALGLLAAPLGLVVLGLAVLLIATFQQLYFGPLFAAPIAVFGQRSAGVVTGVGNLFANLGGFAAVLGLGAVKDATGSLTGGFLALGVLCLLGLLATRLLAEQVRTRGGRHVPPSAAGPPDEGQAVESAAPPARSP